MRQFQPCKRPADPRHRPRIEGFTIVEVMMASVILVVGFLGLITAITIGSEMLASARRQTIAAQIITHELEQLRLKSWTTISGLSSTTTWNPSGSYAAGDIVQYQGGRYQCTAAHTATPALVPSISPDYWVASMAYSNSTAYRSGDVVSSGGTWYRYINSSPSTGNAPPDATYWETYVGAIGSSGIADGVAFSFTRSAADVVSQDLRQVTIVVSWTKSGTKNAASAPTGSWVDRLAFSRPAPTSRNYTRSMTTLIGKYGLNLSVQR